MALAYKERGILLCVSSKNDEAIALDAFRNHPEMILKEEDIVAFRVNWDDKAANIKAIAAMIDLGLESFVFLDDNPAERKRVRDALPGVAVPELPEDPSEWISVFQAAGYFEQTSFSREDRQRAGMYKANARRAEQLERIGNHDEVFVDVRVDHLWQDRRPSRAEAAREVRYGIRLMHKKENSASAARKEGVRGRSNISGKVALNALPPARK